MHFDKQPCSSAFMPCAWALTLTPCGMVGWTGTWLMALLEPPTTAPSPALVLPLAWMCCWQCTDGIRGWLNGGSKHTNSHIQRRTNGPTHIKADLCVVSEVYVRVAMWIRGWTHTHTQAKQGSRKGFAMHHLLHWVGTMAHTNVPHSWSAPLWFFFFLCVCGVFLRPPWNIEGADKLDANNQLWRGWKYNSYLHSSR